MTTPKSGVISSVDGRIGRMLKVGLRNGGEERQIDDVATRILV